MFSRYNFISVRLSPSATILALGLWLIARRQQDLQSTLCEYIYIKILMMIAFPHLWQVFDYQRFFRKHVAVLYEKNLCAYLIICDYV